MASSAKIRKVLEKEGKRKQLPNEEVINMKKFVRAAHCGNKREQKAHIKKVGNVFDRLDEVKSGVASNSFSRLAVWQQ